MPRTKQTILRSPRGKFIVGTEDTQSNTWRPNEGLGIELQIDVLEANGWAREENK